jgi:hypothetical protein
VGCGAGPSGCTPVAVSGVCALVAIIAGGGSLSIRGCLCAVVVVGRVVAWWVLAAVERYGMGGVGLVLVVRSCGIRVRWRGGGCGWSWHVGGGSLWGVVRRGVVMMMNDESNSSFVIWLPPRSWRRGT